MTFTTPTIARIVRWCRRLATRRPAARLPPAPSSDDLHAATDDERPQGCGWFDSSHELQAGLVVLEHASPDAVAPALPLGDWLALHLGGWQGAATALDAA